MSDIKLQAENIFASYNGGKPVLNGVSLDVKRGEMFFLLGPSGCGKSTFLRVIAGLHKQDSGRILLDGKDVSNFSPEHRDVPMVFQSYALWPHMTVFENVAFPMRMQNKSKKEVISTVFGLLKDVNMAEFAKKRVTELSGGQQQRVALARAFAGGKDIVLMDEPLSNLDARLRDHMRSRISEICREKALTVIYVTHDRKEALSMADRAAVFDKGNIVQMGTPKELYTRPNTRFTASFMGDANIITGTFKGTENNGETGVFDTPKGLLRAATEKNARLAAGEVRYIMFRPESVIFDPGENVPNVFDAEIVSSAYYGESCSRVLKIGDTLFKASEFLPKDRAVGTVCRVAFQLQHTVVLGDKVE